MSRMALLAKMKLSSDMAVLGTYEKEVQNKITQTTLTKITSQTSETESCCMSILSNTERAILNTSLLWVMFTCTYFELIISKKYIITGLSQLLKSSISHIWSMFERNVHYNYFSETSCYLTLFVSLQLQLYKLNIPG